MIIVQVIFASKEMMNLGAYKYTLKCFSRFVCCSKKCFMQNLLDEKDEIENSKKKKRSHFHSLFVLLYNQYGLKSKKNLYFKGFFNVKYRVYK